MLGSAPAAMSRTVTQLADALAGSINHALAGSLSLVFLAIASVLGMSVVASLFLRAEEISSG